MNVQILSPHPAHYVYCNIGTPGKWSHSNMAPPGCTLLSIVAERAHLLIKENDQPVCRYEPVTFIGQTMYFKKVSLYDRLKSFFVIFQPCGAFDLLGVHQGECRGNCINLTDLLGSSAQYVEDELMEQSHAEPLKAVVEKFFLKRLYRQKKKEERARFAHVITQIHKQSHRKLLIKELCHQEGYSLRTLERHMKRIVGLTPKQYQRVMRFNKVLQYISLHPRPISWSQIAVRFGYFDQTHFIKEFNLFYGKTPTEYSARNDRFLSNIAFKKEKSPMLLLAS